MTEPSGLRRVTLAPPNRYLFAFIPPGVTVGEVRCEVGSDADLEAIQRANASRLGCATGAIIEAERDGRRLHELRLSDPNGLVTVFWRAV